MLTTKQQSAAALFFIIIMKENKQMISKWKTQGKLKDFVDFLLGEQGQKIVQTLEFVRVN